MSFRDKSNLKDYLRNNSGSKLIDEIKKDFENNRKAWFENKSNTFPFRRDGFPFENDDIFGNKSDPGIKSHLEDLAKKHPEFADDLKRPLWGDDMVGGWEHAFRIPVSVEKEGADKASTSQSKHPEDSHDGHSNEHNGQKNETNNVRQEHAESQESKEPKRFTSKIEITPVNPYEENASASNAQAEPPKDKYQPGTPNSARKQPQVRHIPIFVEGRSEPVVPKNATDNFAHANQTNQFHHQEQQIPIKRKFDNSSESTPLKQEVPIPVHIEKSKPKTDKPEKPKPPQQAEARSPSPKPTPPPKPKDPMTRIIEVQQEVDELAAQVQKFSGNSRTEKSYLYLDEMLTRNLIKLDTIEVEGNDKLRVARKDVIKSIQKAIALLESKVPLPTPTEESQDEEMISTEKPDEMKSVDPSNTVNPMEVDEHSHNVPQKENTANDGGGENK